MPPGLVFRSLFSFICVVLASAAGVFAAESSAADLPPAQAAAAAALPGALHMDFTEYDLPNGLHVILHPDHSIPVAASYVLYHVGSKNERPDRTGFAHFFEHLMFEGSENIPRGRIDKLVSGAGGNLNAGTSFDQTEFYISLPANQLPLALWIESERMMHAKIEDVGVETQRKVVKEERRRSYDNQPYGSLFEEMAKMLFAGTPYAWVPIGSVQYIDQAKIEEFRAFYKTYYLPNNATLALAGDFDVDATKKLVEAYFGPIPAGPTPERPQIHFEPQTEGRIEEVRRQNTPLPATMQAWRVPAERDPDSYPLDLLTNILAVGRSSRLYRRMVDREQVALQVSSFPFLQEDAGMVGIFAVGTRGVALNGLDRFIYEEIAAIQKDGVTQEEFEKARNQKEHELATSYGTMLARARGLAHYHVFYGDTGQVNNELAKYLNVTRGDIQRVAKQYLSVDARNILHYPAAVDAPAPGSACPSPASKLSP